MKPARARYLLRRLGESPPSFLGKKALLVVRRRLDRFPAVRAARARRRLGGDYGELSPLLLRAAEDVRSDVVAEVDALGVERERLVRTLAGELDEGTWTCLGYGPLRLAPGRWHEDDVHGFDWPLAHFAGIDFVRAGTRCDVKVPWERSRLQWFVRAALADLVDEDAERASFRWERVRALVADWIRSNPYGMGVNWVSAMEVAIRASNLLVGFLLSAHRLNDVEARSLLATFGEHLRYLERFPETSDVQGNHHLASRLGAFVLAAPRPGSAARREARALTEAAEEQFTPEGLHVEFAPVYHRLALDMVAVGVAVWRRFLGDEPTRLVELLSRGDAVCRALSAAGELPILGDADGGKVLDVGQEPRRFGHLAAVAASSDDGRTAAPDATLGERLLAALLLGLGGRARVSGAALRTFPACTAIPPFVALRRDADHVVVRAGPLGLAGRASHDHEDQLSFWFESDGRPAVVEAGSPPYTRSAAERAAGLVSSAHNVVARAGSERFTPGEGSVASSVRGGPAGRVESLDAERHEVVLRLVPTPDPGSAGCPREHERTLRLAGGGVLEVLDRFRLGERGSFEARLHLPPGAEAEALEGARARVRLDAGRHLVVRVEGPEGTELAVEPYAFHPDYGAVTRAKCLVVTGPAAGETELRTRLEVRAGGRTASSLAPAASTMEG